MRKFFLSIAIVAITVVAEAQITQWRGENRDGIFGREKNLLTAWPEGGPQQILKVDNLGKGYSSPIYADNTIYVTGMKDTLDYLTALDMTGAIKWQVVYGRSWLKSFPDTRGSATIDGDRIYLVSGTGQLNCLSTKDGKTLWNINVDKDYESEWHMWGVAESPLILDNMVICSPGGQKTSIVAFDKMSGKEIWSTEHIGGQRSYVSPTLYNYNNKTYILATTATHLMAIHPESGKVAWSFKYWNPEKWDQPGLIWANTPIWKGDEIFISMGYNYRAVMLKVNADGTGVTEKFSNEVLDNHHHGLILHDGYVYASNWINNGKGNWVCMDWNTGEIKWETTWENKGSIVLAEGLLYLFDEKGGNVGLVKPNPEKFELISTFKNEGGSGPHWAHPFISDGKLFLRHGEMLMVYNIAK